MPSEMRDKVKTRFRDWHKVNVKEPLFKKFISNSFISCCLFYINDINYEVERLSSVKRRPVTFTLWSVLIKDCSVTRLTLRRSTN